MSGSCVCRLSLRFLLVEVFALPEEPCYQILKMLSSLPRLPTRAGDVPPPRTHPHPHFFTVSHFLLFLPPNVRIVFRLAFCLFCIIFIYFFQSCNIFTTYCNIISIHGIYIIYCFPHYLLAFAGFAALRILDFFLYCNGTFCITQYLRLPTHLKCFFLLLFLKFPLH